MRRAGNVVREPVILRTTSGWDRVVYRETQSSRYQLQYQYQSEHIHRRLQMGLVPPLREVVVSVGRMEGFHGD